MSKTVSVSTANHGNKSNSSHLCQQDYLLIKTLQLKAVNLEEKLFVPPDVTPRTCFGEHYKLFIFKFQTVLLKIFLFFFFFLLLNLLCLILTAVG